jgi:hypothetical protein
MTTLAMPRAAAPLFLPRRAPAVRPVFRERLAERVDPFLREVTVRAGGRLETTRLLDPGDLDFADEVAALEAEGYEPTRLHQAKALVDAADFPRLSASFLAKGDAFYAPDPSGFARNCHAAWDHLRCRFEVTPGGEDAEGRYVAFTKVRYP